MSDRFQIIPAADHLRAHVRWMGLLDSLEQPKWLGPGLPAALLVALDKQPYQFGTHGDVRELSEVRLEGPGFASFPAEALVDSQQIEPLARRGIGSGCKKLEQVRRCGARLPEGLELCRQLLVVFDWVVFIHRFMDLDHVEDHPIESNVKTNPQHNRGCSSNQLCTHGNSAEGKEPDRTATCGWAGGEWSTAARAAARDARAMGAG